MVLEKTLRVPWTARRPNQSILKEISPGCSMEGLMLKLKLQHFGNLMRRVDSLEKTLMLAGTGGRRRRGRQRMRWLDGSTRWTWVWVNSGNLWWTGRPGMLWFMGLQRVGHQWATELNWNIALKIKSFIVNITLQFWKQKTDLTSTERTWKPAVFEGIWFRGLWRWK